MNLLQRGQRLVRIFFWRVLSVKDFLTYIGIVIYMGLVNAKTIAEYWAKKDIYSFPFQQFAMSRSHFQSISWNLHLSNVKDDEGNARKKWTPDYDRLHKIKPFYTDIVSVCKAYFHPRKQLSVDERMVSSKARIGLKQYMKDKPTKCGYKLFVLEVSICTWNFYVYEGKSSSETGKGLSYESVMQLLDLNRLGQGYHIFMDNFIPARPSFLICCWCTPRHVAPYAQTGHAFQKLKSMISAEWPKEGKFVGSEMGSSFLWNGKTPGSSPCVSWFTYRTMVTL